MSIIARQSTARIVTVGPVLNADGVAVTSLDGTAFKLSKNGAAYGALDGTAAHSHTGHYLVSLTTTDLNTVGSAEVAIDSTVNSCGVKEITIIEEVVYDALFVAAATGLPPITTDWLTAVGISAAAANKLADHIKRRTQANTDASSDGDALNLLSFYGLIQQAQESNATATPGTLTVYRTDGTTPLGTRVLAADAAADPIVGIT